MTVRVHPIMAKRFIVHYRKLIYLSEIDSLKLRFHSNQIWQLIIKAIKEFCCIIVIISDVKEKATNIFF